MKKSFIACLCLCVSSLVHAEVTLRNVQEVKTARQSYLLATAVSDKDAESPEVIIQGHKLIGPARVLAGEAWRIVLPLTGTKGMQP